MVPEAILGNVCYVEKNQGAQRTRVDPMVDLLNCPFYCSFLFLLYYTALKATLRSHVTII